jgi:hypothetical protein
MSVIEHFLRALQEAWSKVDWRWPLLALSGIALFFFCALILTTTIFSEALGFGTTEAFYLYQHLGWSRTRTVVYVVLLFGVAATFICLAYLGPPDLSLERWQKFRVFGSNSLLVFASTLTGWMALEIGTRLADGIELWPLRNVTAEKQALLRTHTANDHHPDLGWVLAPNAGLDSTSPNRVITGDFGVRMNSDSILPLRKGGILASGDSLTAGSEVGNSATWPAHLERLVDVPVINGGVGGWATDQIVLRVYQLLPIVKPRTVIVSFFQDDILRSGYRTYSGANKPWFQVRNGELVRHHKPVPLFSGRAREIGGISLLGYSYLLTFIAERLGLERVWYASQMSDVSADNDPVAVSCALLEKLKRDLDAQNIPLIFMMQFGGRHAIDVAQRQSHAVKVLECARSAGINTLDMWDPQAAIGRRNMDAYKSLFVMHDEGRYFGHMSSLGNKLVAEHIAQRLKSLPDLNAQQP